jgi:transcriptional regulator with XRE-family HTH domain
MYALAVKCYFLELRCMISNKDCRYLKAFGKNLRQIREANRLSQEALSSKMDTSPSQVGRIERGEINPTVSTLKVIADALSIDVKDLFNFEFIPEA